MEQQRQALASADNAKDSIRILYNIYDLSKKGEQAPVCIQLFETAGKIGDVKTQLDVSRLEALAYVDEEKLKNLIERVKKLPDSKEKKETILFINLRIIALNALYDHDEKRLKTISEALAKNDFDKLSEHEKIERLFLICQYLGNYVEGDMLVKYVDELMELIKKSDIENYSIYNQFYTSAANIYTATNIPKKAIEADMETLHVIKDLEQTYKAQGREFRNYDITKYVTYRRILSNYPEITVEEANDCYEKILELAKNNGEVKRDLERNHKATIFYLVKNKKYKEALPYIQAWIDKEKSIPVQRRLINTYVEAANGAGDSKAQVDALKHYNRMLEEDNKSQSQVKYNELRIKYDVSRLQSENAQLEIEQKNIEIDETRKIMSFMMVAWVIVAILLIILLYYWTRYRRSKHVISRIVDAFSEQRDNLRERLYHDINRNKESTEITTAEIAKWSKPRGNSMEEMMGYLLNDMMYIASIGSDNSARYVRDVNVGTFMNEEAERVKATLRRNVEFKLDIPKDNITLHTDKECLEYITRHILYAAEKLTPAQGGSIGFSCTEDKTLGIVKFEFTHTGPSLPVGEEEKIFDNLMNSEKLNKNSDSALFICRLTTFLLKANLKSDRYYKDGGKMILTIPINEK